MTGRGFAGFLLSTVARLARQQNAWSAMPSILGHALRLGRPRLLDFAIFTAIWSAPYGGYNLAQSLRSRRAMWRKAPQEQGSSPLMPDHRIKIALCVCTYRRPEGLRRLLSGIAQLRFDSIPAPDIEIIVVENDKDEHARPICEEYRGKLTWPLRYDLEVNPGISQARNRCLRLAADDADFIAFLDDDEMPTPRWLEALLLAQRNYHADVVAGPVVRVYNRPAPNWVTYNLFHRRHVERTGTSLNECSTNNVMFSRILIARDQLKFEEEMGLCGGEDKLFFVLARRKGARLIWCDEAVVEETMPAERTTLLWLLRQAFRIGISRHKCACHLDGRLSASAQSLWFGCTRIAAGLISLPFTVALGRHRSVTALCRMAFGTGCILGAAGYEFNAYGPKA